jgi:hypothetical protein
MYGQQSQQWLNTSSALFSKFQFPVALALCLVKNAIETPKLRRDTKTVPRLATIRKLHQFADDPSILAPSKETTVRWDKRFYRLVQIESRFRDVELAEVSLNTPRYRRKAKIARNLLSPQDALRFFLAPRLDPDFPNIRRIVVAGPESIDSHAYLNDDYPPSRYNFLATEGYSPRDSKSVCITGNYRGEIVGMRLCINNKLLAPSVGFANISTLTSRKLLLLLSLPSFFCARALRDRQVVAPK